MESATHSALGRGKGKPASRCAQTNRSDSRSSHTNGATRPRTLRGAHRSAPNEEACSMPVNDELPEASKLDDTKAVREHTRVPPSSRRRVEDSKPSCWWRSKTTSTRSGRTRATKVHPFSPTHREPSHRWPRKMSSRRQSLPRFHGPMKGTTATALDPLRRMSRDVQRISLSSSGSLTGAWYKDDDVQSQHTGHWYILHPISNGRLVWDYALRFLVLATLVVVPLRLAFVHTTEQLQRSWGLSIILYADVALDALCVLDVLSNFSFGFVTVNPETARREVVSDGRRIAIRYLRKTCALEVLSIGIPFEAAPQRSFETQLLSLFKLLRAQRWLRVRARERHRAHEVGRMPRHVVVEKLSNIFKLLIFFLAWAHLTCCIYCFIGRVQDAQTEHAEGLGMSWMATLRQDQPGRFEEEDVGRVYVISLYWAMATALTIGFGDLTPRTSVEQLFAVFMMLLSSVLYASIFGQVTTLVDSLDQLNRRYQSELQRFTEVASIYRLPWSLRGRIYAHVHFNYQVKQGVDMDTALDSLPNGVRRDVQMYLLSNIVANFPIFANTPVNFVTAVVEKFRNELLVSNEYVFTADEPGKHLYIIHIGRVEVITPEGVIVGKLADGAYFGEVAILLDVRRTSSVRTVCRCHFYKLSKEDFEEVLEGFPELRERIVAKAMQRMQKTNRVRSKTSNTTMNSIPEGARVNGSRACSTVATQDMTGCAAAPLGRRSSSSSAEDQSTESMHVPRGMILKQQSSPALLTKANVAKLAEAASAPTSDDCDAAPLRVLANGIPQSCQQWERKITIASNQSFEEMSTHQDPPSHGHAADFGALFSRLDEMNDKLSRVLAVLHVCD